MSDIYNIQYIQKDQGLRPKLLEIPFNGAPCWAKLLLSKVWFPTPGNAFGV